MPFITRQARDDGGSKQHGGNGCGEKWSGSGCILKVKPDGFSDACNVGVREREMCKMAPRLMV